MILKSVACVHMCSPTFYLSSENHYDTTNQNIKANMKKPSCFKLSVRQVFKAPWELSLNDMHHYTTEEIKLFKSKMYVG